ATREELKSALRGARSEAKSAFGDDRVYVEKAIVRPRHVEVQVLGDTHGHVLHLYERECSIQRRHQKVIEESPSLAVDQKTREQMGRVAVLPGPSGIGGRDDSGVYEGFEVSTFYDPMISKLVAWGSNRDEAIDRMLRALREYTVVGPVANIAFHRWALEHPAFRAGDI